MSVKKISSLELEKEAEKIQLKYVFLRRVSIFVLILFLIIALLGLAGGAGILEKKTIRDKSNTLYVEYSPFLREFFSSSLKVIVQPKPNQNKILLRSSLQYLNQFYIKQILPKPYSIQLIGNEIVFEFFLASHESPFIVNFLLEPQSFGLVKETFNVGEQSINFKQFIYP